MLTLTFVTFAGTSRAVDVPDGTTVMEAAVDNGLPGIDGDCGGNCACATCHVYVDESWLARTGSRSDMEEAMLDFAAGARPNSRLGCQIVMSAALDGLIVTTPESQH